VQCPAARADRLRNLWLDVGRTVYVIKFPLNGYTEFQGRTRIDSITVQSFRSNSGCVPETHRAKQTEMMWDSLKPVWSRSVIGATAKDAFVLLLILLLSCGTLHAQDRPPRIEIGAVLSTTSQSDIGNYFHFGGGGRITINATRYLAGEVEATRQPTGNSVFPPELHTAIAAKFTYRAEQARWLKVAGLNFFGVAGPAFLNRTVEVLSFGCPSAGCEPPLQRQTATMLDWGGGFEVVPTRALAVRFDATHAAFSEPVLYSSQTLDRHRTYLKVAVMLRLP
jgi:hypothetical protein